MGSARPLPDTGFWAKLDTASGQWHPLIAHAADVNRPGFIGDWFR